MVQADHDFFVFLLYLPDADKELVLGFLSLVVDRVELVPDTW